MKTIQETSLEIFSDAVTKRTTSTRHQNTIVWWIDDLAKKIENIRETSLNREDALTRLYDLSLISGISIKTLFSFYDKRP